MKEGTKDNRTLLTILVVNGLNNKVFGVVNNSINLFKLLISENMESTNMDKIIKELILLLGNNNSRLSKNSRDTLVQLVDMNYNLNQIVSILIKKQTLGKLSKSIKHQLGILSMLGLLL